MGSSKLIFRHILANGSSTIPRGPVGLNLITSGSISVDGFVVKQLSPTEENILLPNASTSTTINTSLFPVSNPLNLWLLRVSELSHRLRVERAVLRGSRNAVRALMGVQMHIEKGIKLQVMLLKHFGVF
ncbi:unnamed protein product [Protopolystoma xenopodis]|uniref:Uncharacterized protein n=1 Tax=Protopolystoma xenopodis TaxID=117903 RepID=A0A448XPZ2_9PLAT|nr:unnamed protein product [Protopolystoma xenopodis]